MSILFSLGEKRADVVLSLEGGGLVGVGGSALVVDYVVTARWAADQSTFFLLREGDCVVRGAAEGAST